MRNARTRFWSSLIVMAAIWLNSLIFGGADSPFDAAVRAAIYEGDDPARRQIAAMLSWAGNGIILSVLTVLGAVYLSFHRKMRAGLLLLMVFSGRLLVELQKMIVSRDRPGVDEHLEAVNSMSFPSAHSANAMITYLALGLLVPVAQRYRAIAVAVGAALALLTGWSRVALGVHWPSDVIGGWAFGILWVIVCIRLASARPEVEQK